MRAPFLSLGPFQGITDAPFRNVFKRHFGGIDKFYTPFFTGIQKDHAKNLQVEEIDPKCNDVETLTPQILSTDAEEILRFAKQCKQLGYKEVNLNMGCPFPRVANKKRGCGLLPYPDMVETMLERIFEEIDINFSVKCRLGYFSPDEIEAIIPIFNKFPLSELIIHPRIGKQLYKGEADVERFKALIPYINAPLVYNGDIFSVESFGRIKGIIEPQSCRGLRAKPETTPTEETSPDNLIAGNDPQSAPLNGYMLGWGLRTKPETTPTKETTPGSVIAGNDPQSAPLNGYMLGRDLRAKPETTPTEETTPGSVIAGNDPQSAPLNGYMLGRGILANPFLAEDIRGGAWNAPERKERLHAYIIDLYEDRLRHAGGSPKVLGRMKELWSYLMQSFEDQQNVWRRIKKINALREYEEAVEEIFNSIELDL